MTQARFSALNAVANLADLMNQDDLAELPLNLIDADPDQPRRDWDTEDMQKTVRSMANSIMALGVLQPITVVKTDNGRYRIVTGETRWRASREAGKDTICAIVRKRIDPTTLTDQQIVENEVRKSLNPVDLALAVQSRIDAGVPRADLLARYGWTQQVMSKRLSVLNFDPEVQRLAREGIIRDIPTLAALDQMDAAERARTIASLASGDVNGAAIRGATKKKNRLKTRVARDPNIKALASRLGDHFGAAVSIQHSAKKGNGVLQIKYTSLDTLDGILERCNLPKEQAQD